MKNIIRQDSNFSMCGLNCNLCSMKLGGYCPGCGRGDGNQPCKILKCGIEKKVEYCYECNLFPCEKYHNITQYDSFITHRNQIKDLEKAKSIGIGLYSKEQVKKSEILNYLLTNYNDGRRKTMFCIAVNLMEIDVLESIIDKAKKMINNEDMSIKSKALIVDLLSNIWTDLSREF